MPCYEAGVGFAYAGYSEAVQKPLGSGVLCLFDGIFQIFKGFFAEALHVDKLVPENFNTEQVGRFSDKTSGDELFQ